MREHNGRDDAADVEETARAQKLAEEDLLRQALDEKEKLVKDFQDKWLRALAEVENIRKRTEREKADAMMYSQVRVLTAVITIFDAMERAVAGLDAQPGIDGKIREGFSMLLKNAKKIMELEGVVRVEAKAGTPYDPNFHEVIRVKDDQGPEGLILEVVQDGYLLGTRVLRPARVVVAGHVPETQGQEPSGKGKEKKL